MNHVGILKKALHITFRHRALWVLGVLWALMGGSGGGSGGSRAINFINALHENNLSGKMNATFFHLKMVLAQYLGWILLGACFLVLLGSITVVVRYILQAGVYRVFYHLEAEGKSPTVGAGFREGWHRRTWRLFLQNLIVALITGIIMAFFFAMIALPALLLLSESSAAHWAAVAGICVWGMLALIAVFLLSVALNVLSRFWWRAAIIDDMGAVDAMGYAWRLVKTHFNDVAVVWLLMFGVGLLFGMIMFILMLFLFGLGAMVAGFPGYLLYEATGSIFAGLLWGVPIGLAIFILPMFFVTGLYLIFNVSVWNDLYLQLTHPELGTQR